MDENERDVCIVIGIEVVEHVVSPIIREALDNLKYQSEWVDQERSLNSYYELQEPGSGFV